MPGRFVQFDCYERHRAASALLEETAGRWVLDVGGIRGLLAAHLPEGLLLTLNVDCSGDVQYGGRAIPFVTEAFQMVVSLDTIEHVPRERRLPFLAECCRVSQHTVLIAAPLGTPGHSAYEAKLDAFHKQVHGRYNQMLHEHVLYGLPTMEHLDSWNKFFSERGFSSQLRYTGDYVWQCRNMERSLRLVQRLGALGKLAGSLNLIASLAIWRPIVLSEQATETTNRFYFLAQRR